MIDLLPVTFISIWFVGLAGFLFYLFFEMPSIYQLKPAIYRYGLLVLKRSRIFNHDRYAVNTNEIFLTKHGRSIFINLDECLFCRKLSYFWVSPFPVKGKINFIGEKVIVTGRIPVGTTVFLGFIITTFLTFLFVEKMSNIFMELSYFLPIFVVAIIISVLFERFRALKVANEILGELFEN